LIALINIIVGFELAAAKNVTATNHDRNFATELLSFVNLLGDVDHFFHANSAFARRAEAFARKFKKDAFVFSGSHAFA